MDATKAILFILYSKQGQTIIDTSHVHAEQGRITIGKRSNELRVELIRRPMNMKRNAFVIQLAGPGDFAAQSGRKISLPSSSDDVGFVIQLDLRDQQPRIPARRLFLVTDLR